MLTEYLDRARTDYSAAQPDALDAHRLQDALRVRCTINQAIGVLMATDGITADQAQGSFEQRVTEGTRTAEQIAHDIITQHTAGADGAQSGL